MRYWALTRPALPVQSTGSSSSNYDFIGNYSGISLDFIVRSWYAYLTSRKDNSAMNVSAREVPMGGNVLESLLQFQRPELRFDPATASHYLVVRPLVDSTEVYLIPLDSLAQFPTGCSCGAKRCSHLAAAAIAREAPGHYYPLDLFCYAEGR
jgi:hypothetical protein